MEKESVLTVKDLSVSFHMYDKGLEQYDLKVISNLDLEVCPGEIVAIAGSSGSGKSLLAHAVMGLLPENAILDGEIIYKGRKLNQKDKEKLRGKELALAIQENMNRKLSIARPRVAKGNRTYYLLKRSPGVINIVECGFLTNPEEAALLQTEKYQRRVAEAVADGIVTYLKKQKENENN